jgi:hypothetical protein
MDFARIIKTDDSGNIQWDKQYGGQKDDKANSIIQTQDGSYLFVGVTDGNETISHYITWIVKLDASGNIEWQKTDAPRRSRIFSY